MVAALHEAAVQLGMERDALLSGIDRSVVSSIPIRQTLAAQLLTDLNELNSIGTLADGSSPLRNWLINASLLSRERQSAMIFVTSLRAVGFDDSSRSEESDANRARAAKDFAAMIGQASQPGEGRNEPPGGDGELRRLKSLFARMVYLHVEQTGITTHIGNAMPTDGMAWDSYVRPTVETIREEAQQLLDLLRTIAREGDDLPLAQQSLYRRLVASMRERISFYTMFLAFRFSPEPSTPATDILKHLLCDIDNQYRCLVNELHELGDALEDYIKSRAANAWVWPPDSAQLCLANAVGRGFYHEVLRQRVAPKDAKRTLAQAELKFGTGDFSEALALYRQLERHVPGVLPKLKIAMCLDNLGRLEEAVEAYSRFLDCYPSPAVDDEYVSHARKRIDQMTRL